MALIAQLGEHSTGIAEVVGSNPVQSLKIFSGLCSSSVTAALALMTFITQLLLWDKLLSFKFEEFRTFLCVFMSIDKVFVNFNFKHFLDKSVQGRKAQTCRLYSPY